MKAIDTTFYRIHYSNNLHPSTPFSLFAGNESRICGNTDVTRLKGKSSRLNAEKTALENSKGNITATSVCQNFQIQHYIFTYKVVLLRKFFDFFINLDIVSGEHLARTILMVVFVFLLPLYFLHSPAKVKIYTNQWVQNMNIAIYIYMN